MDLVAFSFAFIGILSIGYILYEDIKAQKVSFIALIFLCLSIIGEFFYLQLPLNYISACFIGSLFSLFYLFQKIGSADVLLGGILGLTLPLPALPLFLILSGAFGLLSSIFFKDPTHKFPFIPSLLLGWLITYLYPFL